MEAQLGMSAAIGLASVGIYAGRSCFGGGKAKIHKEPLCALVLSKHTGKSSLKACMNSISDDLTIVDVDGEVEGDNNELKYLVARKDYVKDLVKEFPKRKFLLLTSSVEEASYYGVPDVAIFVCVPSNELFRTLVSNLSPSSGDLVKAMESSRMQLVRSTLKEKLNIFNTFEELYNVIRATYKLQATF